VKRKQIRILSRNLKQSNEVINKELGLSTGSVWSIEDASVPFDAKRNLKDIKQTSRPCLVLTTPIEFGDSSTVLVAPGTSKVHPTDNQTFPCLKAPVPPEDLKQTTYFLLYFKWHAVQKTLQKKITELSFPAQERLRSLMKGNYE